MEVGDVRADLQQLGFGLLEVLGVFAARVHAHVVEHRREHFVRRVHHRHAAGAELLDVFRFEQHGPGVDLVDAQHSLDLVDVIADAVGAPQVRHRVRVARIVFLQQRQQFRVEVLEVRQLLAIELEERAGLYLAGEEVVRRHDHVIPGATGKQLAFQGFVGVENVVDHLDPGLGLEVGEGGFADVVGPVVDADLWLSLGNGAEQDRECGRDHGFQ
ncbi:hypothetical protein D3C72_1141870 [compost metagenome]